MSYQTSKTLMILRVAAVHWKVIIILGLLFGMIPGIGVLFLVVAVVATMMWMIALGVRLFGNVVYGNDPDYKKWRAMGGDPYFSLLPEGINNDSLAVRSGGRPEPQTEFTPPDNWLVQCQGCGARNESYGPCWHCGKTLVQKITPPSTMLARRQVAFDPTTYEPRTAQCPKCQGLVRELEFGKFETGVSCPYCRTIMQIVVQPLNPNLPPRTTHCTTCNGRVIEPVFGQLDRGMNCPHCGTLLFTVPQVV